MVGLKRFLPHSLSLLPLTTDFFFNLAVGKVDNDIVERAGTSLSLIF
jgi:hypothetical protein